MMAIADMMVVVVVDRMMVNQNEVFYWATIAIDYYNNYCYCYCYCFVDMDVYDYYDYYYCRWQNLDALKVEIK
jgi:hypothetical protein